MTLLPFAYAARLLGIHLTTLHHGLKEAPVPLAVLQERERSVERRITVMESLLEPLRRRQMPDPPAPEAEQAPACRPPGSGSLHPAEQRARSRMPALIEYSASGSYVIISAQDGEVHLEPDSRAWFD